MVEFVGLTGPVTFDTLGKRTQFSVDVMEQRPEGQVKVGSWNSVDRLLLNREEKHETSDTALDPMANKSFIITSILVRLTTHEITDLQTTVTRTRPTPCWLSLTRS